MLKSFTLISMSISLYVSQARTIREFDDLFTAKTFGYASVEEYYETSSIALKSVDNINVPLLCLNSYDDPFVPGDCKYSSWSRPYSSDNAIRQINVIFLNLITTHPPENDVKCVSK